MSISLQSHVYTVVCPAPLVHRIFPDNSTEAACHFLLQGIFPDRDQVCISYTGRQILNQ